MTIKPDWVSRRGDIVLYCADYMDVLPELEDGAVSSIIVDPPYSDRSHCGHNNSANGHGDAILDDGQRRVIQYQSWSEEVVESASREFARVSSGWVVAFTDHVLMPAWSSGLEHAGRYVFAPLVLYAPGSRCRLSGDGPSCWCTWIVVARTAKQCRWGTLPGGYLQTHNETREIAGAKTIKIMDEVVRDYSRTGDVVCDPCMGSASTGISCIRTGRRFMGVEKNPDYFKIAVRRIEKALAERDEGLYGPAPLAEPERRLFDDEK